MIDFREAMICGWQNIKRWLVAVMFAVVIPCPGHADRFDDPIVLSGVSSENRHPAIAASPDGQRLFAVWDGIIDGARRIVLRECLMGEWLPEVIVDSEPSAENQSPSVAVDALGNPFVTWLARAGNRPEVFVALRAGGVWANHGAISVDSNSGDSCEAAGIRIAPDGMPWVVWQAGSANRYGIRCATLNAETGEFVTFDLTPDARNYNLYPEIFFLSEPWVVWYAAENAEFSIVGERFNPSTRSWAQLPIRDLEKMPANRLPFLIRTDSGALAALWYDEHDFSDRVFLGVQDPDSKGAGSTVDHRPEASNHLVSGGFSSGELVATWCADDPLSNSQVFLTHGKTVPLPVESLVSDGSPRGYYTAPRLCALPGGTAVIWHSDTVDGGDGRIIVRRVQF